MNKGEKGLTLAASLIVSAAMAVLVISLAKIINTNAVRETYLNSMYRSYRLAESGLNEAVMELTINPSAYLNPSFSLERPGPDPNGKFSVIVEKRNYQESATSIKSLYYIQSKAEYKIHGRKFISKLHTYAEISNVSDYFAAINGTLSIVQPQSAGQSPTDLSKGKVYGKRINFITDGNAATQTLIKRAEFVKSKSPLTSSVTPPLPWDATVRSEFVIYNPQDTAINQPVELTYPLLFPQVLESDIEYYGTKAHVDLLPPINPAQGHRKCLFPEPSETNAEGVMDIFPPGHRGDPVSLNDKYAGHTNTNIDHVYFCEGDMTIKGKIHGQVLFVATGDIHLSSNVISAASTDPMPGAGGSNLHVGSSTAHQGIFITRGNVFIDNTYLNGPPFDNSTQRIEGLFMAPYGTIFPQTYSPVEFPAGSGIVLNPHQFLSLNFNGSMVLNATPDFQSVFNNRRTYTYMESLKSYPPPDVPSLVKIYFSIEETSVDPVPAPTPASPGS